MALARFLVDTSASARLDKLVVRDRLQPILDRGLAATCSILDLEALFSARNAADYERLSSLREAVYEYVEISDDVLIRACELQAELAEQGKLRAVGIADLIIAATAEKYGLVVLHYDGDFDHLADISSAETEWVVARGTADGDGQAAHAAT